ncbi:MAG: pyridoxamine 5'-phosphate oxidase [bacterium]|nr:pyridoxamine 5'-phosphate oxidase [bacterium]
MISNTHEAKRIEDALATGINPVELFRDWFNGVSNHPDIKLPDAFCLSTVSPDGKPEGRMLLLKGVDNATGFRFFTNQNSNKGHSLTATPLAAMTFYWEAIRRQVRIQGRVIEASSADSDDYFNSRPLMSKIGAWASDQSQRIESRAALEEKLARCEAEFGQNVPRPPHWVGFDVVPEMIEFWLEQPSRLHDRFVFKRSGTNANWNCVRLQP